MGLNIDLIRKKYITITYDKVNFTEENEVVYNCNITHNLGTMASECDLYDVLWRPHRLHEDYKRKYDFEDDEYKFESSAYPLKAKQIVDVLKNGLKELVDNPEKYKRFNAKNGWGKYEEFVQFVENYLKACILYPEASIIVSR